MAIRFSPELEKQFKESSKNIRLWPTWKLQYGRLGLRGERENTIWELMSKHDQKFNLEFNELSGLIRKARIANQVLCWRITLSHGSQENDETTKTISASSHSAGTPCLETRGL